MTPEQKAHYNKELAEIRRGGNCNHEAWAVKSIGGMGNETLGPVDPPVVALANDYDGYYVQYFRDRAELDVFISKLITAANEAWGDKYVYLRNIHGLRVDDQGNVGIGS